MKQQLQAGGALLDPPWPGQGAPYDTVTIRRLLEFPLLDFLAPSAAVFIWVPANHMVVNAIHFATKNELTLRGVISWFKGRPGRPTRYLQANTELLLYFTRGDCPARVRGVGTSIFAPTELHSQKPAEALDLVERVAPVGTQLVEFFARTSPRSAGWITWGAELEYSEITVDGWPVSSDFQQEVA